MASVYLNSGQGPHSEDCTYRCPGIGDGEFSGSPFSPFSSSPPPSAPQPCRHSQLDLVNVGYQRNGYDSSERYSISMRGNEPVQVHLELGSPPAAKNTQGYYSYNPPTTKSLVSSSTLVLASIVVTLVSIHFVKTFNAHFFVRWLIQMLQAFEEKPRKTFRDIWTQTPSPPRASPAQTRSIDIPTAPLGPVLPLSDEMDTNPEIETYQVPPKPPSKSSSPSPVVEHPDPQDAPAFEKNIRWFILPKLKLDLFFPPDSDFISKISVGAADLRRENTDPRTIKRLVHLSLYQPVIYCDDSGSMKDRRYNSQRELVRRIARIATTIVPPEYGVELRFINDKFSANLQASQIDAAIARVKPEDHKLSNLGTGLRTKILKPLVYDILDKPGRRLERPLLVCVITDGHPYPEGESIFKDNIVECRQRLIKASYNPTAVMFVVSQIGNEQTALAFLGKLRDDPEIRDVLYCTTSRLDKELEELRENERRLDEWLLCMLTKPIIMEPDDGQQSATTKELAEAQEELEFVEKPGPEVMGEEGLEKQVE